MKLKRKIGDLGKDQIRQLIESFLDELDEGAVALLEYFDEAESSQFETVEVDSEGRILSFTQKDGSHYAYNLKSETIDALAERISALEDAESVDNFENIEDLEGRLQIGKDSEDKVYNYRRKDGVLVENSGIETSELSTNKLSLTKDGMDSLIGDLENAGINKDNGNYHSPNYPKYGITSLNTEVFFLTKDPDVSSIDDVVLIFDYENSDENALDRMTVAHYYVNDASIVDNGDGTYTPTSTSKRLRHYAAGKVKQDAETGKYYAKDPIRKIDGVCYYADTLGYSGTGQNRTNRTKVIEGYTVEAPFDADLAEGAVKQSNVEVVMVTGPVCVNAWTVEDWDFNGSLGADIGKKYEHQCVGEIDFGHYLTKDVVYLGVKHQGNSTMVRPKRNYRYTFYKNSSYSKKEKVKFGEMLRLSGYNLKANYNETSRIKELILYRLFVQIWQNRPVTDRFDWDYKSNGLYHGATGNIQVFPVRFLINGDFYGLYEFGLKKDEKNFMLDGEDESGLLVSGSTNSSNAWGRTLPYNIKGNYDDEYGAYENQQGVEEISPTSVEALENWHHFINERLYNGSDNNEYNVTELTEVEGTMYVTSTLEGGVPVASSISAELIKFNKKNCSERLDVLGFIDYFICMQSFIMYDSTHNNVIMYSNEDKKKIFPFFYDLDDTMPWSFGENVDILTPGVSLSSDMSFWENFTELYWDEIVDRYCELRKTFLNVAYMTAIYNDVKDSIPTSDYTDENEKWGDLHGIKQSAEAFKSHLIHLVVRFNFLDNSYFKI